MKLKFGNIRSIGTSSFVNNSFWGLLSTVFQTLFLSLFFIIISRYYSIPNFSDFLIANTIYQLIVGFSSMGLGHWFIREYGYKQEDQIALSYRFIKIQTILGFLFYLINIGLAFIIYPSEQIRVLAIILGTNIIFDNIIYALKSLNIAQFQQKKTAIIMAADGLLRLAIGSILFFYPLSLIYLSVLLVIIRLATVNVFIRIGSEGIITFSNLWRFKVTLLDFKKNVLLNWNFILIVGSSIIFWRSATIIISKYLTAADVANYEIAYKIFSIFTQLSIVASVTIYPKFVGFIASKDDKSVRKFYNIVSFGYAVFVITTYGFIQSYAQTIIPFIFGQKFLQAADCMKEMFLTLLMFPAVFLQANLLVAMKKERLDMLLNFLVLVVNLTGCLIGLHYSRSLSVINYSIFGSFVVFHVAQNIVLIKLKISNLKNAITFYLLIACFVLSYKYLIGKYSPNIVFICFVLLVIVPLLYMFYKKIRNHFSQVTNFEIPAESEITV
jgi:O-antigen/teichoic acid export membrane protein